MAGSFVGSWDEVPAGLRPVAPMTGPFPHRAFLEAWEVQRPISDGLTTVVATDSGAMPLWVDHGTVRFAGAADLTDYHSPLGSSFDELIAHMSDRFSGHAFSFDSLPAEALEPLASSLAEADASFTSRIHAATLLIDLPAEPREWLRMLPKKHRHEIRRKQRRFVQAVGEPLLERRTDPATLDAFVEMHRSATGEKGSFITERMKTFFSVLIEDADASIDLLTVDDRPVAAAFGFADAGAYYLYNLAYAADLADSSPGIVLLSAMIEQAIVTGLIRFDFLKGDERYKYQMGAFDRPLSIVEGVFP
jgi:CelD/BcsL family acetyltransferase involved in cellulose biosynthesis